MVQVALTPSQPTAMPLQAACAWAQQQLEQTGFAADEARREARHLLRLATALSITQQVANPHAVVDDAALATLQQLTQRRAAREPMAYLEGSKEFMGLRFEVAPSTLIPRPDSETLVEAALALLPAHAPARVLDLGTGTGCLLLSVLHARPQAHGVGTDRTEEVAALAHRNAEALEMQSRTQFYSGDWWNALPHTETAFDMLLCNPPYIAHAEKPDMMPDVRDYEPESALFAAENGLAEYRRIAMGVRAHVRPGGYALFEVGHTQAEAVHAIAQASGLAFVQYYTDLAGKARVVCMRTPE